MEVDILLLCTVRGRGATNACRVSQLYIDFQHKILGIEFVTHQMCKPQLRFCGRWFKTWVGKYPPLGFTK